MKNVSLISEADTYVENFPRSLTSFTSRIVGK